MKDGTHKETISMEVDVPDGYSLTGEIREPRDGEPYTPAMIDNGVLCFGSTRDDEIQGRTYRRLILSTDEPDAVKLARFINTKRSIEWLMPGEALLWAQNIIAEFEAGSQ